MVSAWDGGYNMGLNKFCLLHNWGVPFSRSLVGGWNMASQALPSFPHNDVAGLTLK